MLDAVSARAVLIAVALWAAASPTQAAPVDCMVSGPLDVLLARGSDPCGGGRIAFADFTYEVIATGGAYGVPADAVWVDRSSTRFSEGVDFRADWRVGPGESLEVRLGYSFSAIRLYGGMVAGVWTDPSWWPASVAGTICLGSAWPCAPDGLYAFEGFMGGGGVTFPARLSPGRVEVVFRIEGTDDVGFSERVAVTWVNTSVSVPEPSFLALVAVGAGLARRRGRRLRS